MRSGDGLYCMTRRQHVESGPALKTSGQRRASGLREERSVNLIYARILEDGAISSIEDKFSCPRAAGLIGENVYLYCASEGLATVLRANIENRHWQT